MNILVILSIVSVTVSFILYTLSVISGRKVRELKRNHAMELWIGFICNILGMAVMTAISNEKNIITINETIKLFHVITGVSGMFLMLIHCLWATWALYEENEKAKKIFYKLSFTVWLLWLIPYALGMYIGIRG